MQNKGISNKKYKGGFIGLLVLLITVAIIAILIVRTDLFSVKNQDIDMFDQDSDKNVIERGMDAIDSARNAKNLIEQHTREATGQ